MNVRDSTRATSAGSDIARYEFGFLASSSLVNVPASTNCAVNRSHSASEPSANTTRSGCVNSATSVIHANSSACRVGGLSPDVFKPGNVAAVMAVLLGPAASTTHTEASPTSSLLRTQLCVIHTNAAPSRRIPQAHRAPASTPALIRLDTKKSNPH